MSSNRGAIGRHSKDANQRAPEDVWGRLRVSRMDAGADTSRDALAEHQTSAPIPQYVGQSHPIFPSRHPSIIPQNGCPRPACRTLGAASAAARRLNATLLAHGVMWTIEDSACDCTNRQVEGRYITSSRSRDESASGSVTGRLQTKRRHTYAAGAPAMVPRPWSSGGSSDGDAAPDPVARTARGR